MPLDGPEARAFIAVRSIGRSNKHWVGCNDEWIAFVRERSRWYLFNVYTNDEIQVPRVRDVGIHPEDPFRYHRNMMSVELLKIQIVRKPYKDAGGVWNYFLIAVFDKMIAIMRGGVDSHWKILNAARLAPSTFVDAIQDLQDRIYAVTELHGDVFLREPTEWGSLLLHKLVLHLLT